MSSRLRRLIAAGVLGGRADNSYAGRLMSIAGSNLFRYYPLDEATGSVAYDRSANVANGAYSTGTTPLLAQTGEWGEDKTSVTFRANSYLNPYSAAFASGINVNEFSVGFVLKPPAADGSQHNAFYFRADLSNYIGFYFTDAGLDARWSGGGTLRQILSIPISYTTQELYVLTVSKASNRARVYAAGIQQYSDSDITGTWSGALEKNKCLIGNYVVTSPQYFCGGNMQHWFWINGAELTAQQVYQLSTPPGTTAGERNVLILGDSKSLNYYTALGYRRRLQNSVWASDRVHLIESPAAIAVTGLTTAKLKARTAADIAAMTTTPDVIIYAMGANDLALDTLAENYATDTNWILDAYHTAFPNATVKMAKIWRQNHAASIAAQNTAIDDDILPTRTGWLSVGINEQDILPGEDDGATYTSDGTHYSAAGAALIAAAWGTALGY